MAGLTAAWELSRPEHRGRIDQVTVYQRGWRLGGKGASSRGAHGRIEEHGLHVWLGYYDNAFRLMREAYDELDRRDARPRLPRRAPGATRSCPRGRSGWRSPALRGGRPGWRRSAPTTSSPATPTPAR